MKYILIAALILSPVVAEAKGKKSKPKPASVVTVAPKPVAPTPVTPPPAPNPTTTPAIDAFTQSQIDKALAATANRNPLDNCTYCGAAAVARGEWVQ